MSDAAYVARTNTKTQVIEAGAKIPFETINNAYTHDAAAQLNLGLHRMMQGIFNPAEPGKGMSALLRSSTDPTNPSALSKIKSTDAANISTVLEASIAEAKAKQAASKDPTAHVEADITTRADAVDAADRQNQLNQAVIGAKEGWTEAIVTKVGKRVTDTVLRTADGTDYKSVDEYELCELINAVMQAAERPKIETVLAQLTGILGFKFNFQQRFSDNVNVLRARIAKTATHGVTFPDGMLAIIILANANEAAHHAWGREIETEVAKLRLMYKYDHAHDAASIAAILKGLAAADSVRNLMAAPTPAELGQANAARSAISCVEQLIFDDDSSDEEGTAASATGYTSDVTTDTRRPSRLKSKSGKEKRASSKSRSTRGEEYTAENNPCKHCKKWGRRNRHPQTTGDKCFWNKKWKGFRPRYVCRKMNIPFHNKDSFPAHLGGYASDVETTSDEE